MKTTDIGNAPHDMTGRILTLSIGLNQIEKKEYFEVLKTLLANAETHSIN